MVLPSCCTITNTSPRGWPFWSITVSCSWPVAIEAVCHNGMGVPLATLQRQAQHSMNAISRRIRDFENIATTNCGSSPDEAHLLLQLGTKNQPSDSNVQ